MINETSLVGVRMFNVIDNRLRSIEYIQKGGLDLIRIGDFFYQTPSLQTIEDNVNALTLNFWQTFVQRYE
jgi:hypothetical protein